MRELSEGRRLRDRVRLMRALKDVQSGKARGLLQGEEGAIKELLILRIAEIDRILGVSGSSLSGSAIMPL